MLNYIGPSDRRQATERDLTDHRVIVHICGHAYEMDAERAIELGEQIAKMGRYAKAAKLKTEGP